MKEKLPLEEINTDTPELNEIFVGENKLRPQVLKDYIGQQALTSRLEIFMTAARSRSKPLDHTLLSGPPGLGKTTLAHIIANEMGGQLHQCSGPTLEKTVDLLAILTNLKERDVLFVDEIHRLNISIEETLYPALEDNKIQVVVGEGAAAQSVTLPVQPFTLIGATTQAGRLSAPLRDRFGIHLNLDFYSFEETLKILKRSAKILEISLTDEELHEVALRSRGTPRIANRLLARVRDYLDVMRSEKSFISEETREYLEKNTGSTKGTVIEALDFLDIDSEGLQAIDRRYLQVLSERFSGGPAGIEALCASLSEDRRTLEEMVEPYLLKKGYIVRTPRGRMLTALQE